MIKKLENGDYLISLPVPSTIGDADGVFRVRPQDSMYKEIETYLNRLNSLFKPEAKPERKVSP